MFIVVIEHAGSEPRNTVSPVSVFEIVAISTHLVVITFLEVPFFVKAHAHGTDSLAQIRGACSFSFTSRANVVVSTSYGVCKIVM